MTTLRGREWAALIAAVTLLLATGCGGGGDPPANEETQPFYLTGWWESWVRPRGGNDPYELIRIFRGADDGATFRWDGQAVPRTPTGVEGASPNATDPDRIEWDLERDANGELVGSTTTYAGGVVVSDWDTRLIGRGAPVGTFVIYGTEADVHSITAYASRNVRTAPLLSIVHSDPDQPIHLLLQFDGPPPWVADLYDVGAGDIRASVIVDGELTRAVTGHVDFGRLDDERAEGDFDLELEGGGTATGNFSTEILIDLQP